MRILIAIHGAHSQPDQMQAQRETWLQTLTIWADYKFFLGRATRCKGDCGDAECEQLNAALKAPDVVTVNCDDGPLWNGPQRTLVLNRKTEALVRYALEHDYEYVFKCDDDTYIRTDLLWSSGFEQHDYVGLMGGHHAQGVGDYSWAQGGAGYWLSRRAMEIIDAAGLHLARAEDFAVGQILALHGIRAHNETRYVPAVTEEQLANPDPDSITFHKVNPQWMRRLHGR